VIFVVAFAWGWSEATVFFIVPDVLLTLLALRSPRMALAACLWATFGAVVGGAMTYDYANLHPASSREILVMIPGISDRLVGEVGEQFYEHGDAALFLGPLRGIPYKIYAVQAAWQRRPLVDFLLVSIPARAIRFVLTSVLASVIAAPLRRRVRERTLVHIHLLAWSAFYAAYFAAHGL
jgi:membrane protein YqaA with SNARE-associated domain